MFIKYYRLLGVNRQRVDVELGGPMDVIPILFQVDAESHRLIVSGRRMLRLLVAGSSSTWQKWLLLLLLQRLYY